MKEWTNRQEGRFNSDCLCRDYRASGLQYIGTMEGTEVPFTANFGNFHARPQNLC
jgi:hypothetical protein